MYKGLFMDIQVSANVITISGNIKSVSDYQKIKSEIDKVVTTQKEIRINIPDSISIISSVIGYFNKLIMKDKIVLNMSVGNACLMELLEELNLKSLFNVSKV